MSAVLPQTLYIVGTPIGNLEDITLRGLETLRQVDIVYAEDTRVSTKLLSRYQIKKPLRSYREAASTNQVEKIISTIIGDLQEGKSLAYVSDAGTPGISDPGSFLVKKVIEAGFTVVPIPGPSALASIVSISGFPAARPLFVGFLPKKKGHQTLLGKLRDSLDCETCDTIILYESPERIVKLLQELLTWPFELMVCVGREMTKLHEELLRGTTDEVLKELSKRNSVKGEITIIISKAS